MSNIRETRASVDSAIATTPNEQRNKQSPVCCPMEESKVAEAARAERTAFLLSQRPSFQPITENEYRTRESRPEEVMPCQCHYRIACDPPYFDCGEASDCINRLLMVECDPDSCPTQTFCQNQRFQRKEYTPVELFDTSNGKGYGLRTCVALPANAFIMEYVGEVLNQQQFKKRTQKYSDQGEEHFYFMTLRPDEIIDASQKGNLSRFMNHSCNPNCCTQKWIVQGQIRIGLFTLRALEAGTELTFDYKFERYGSKAQQCLCGEENCKGTIGVDGNSSGQKKSLTDSDYSSDDDSDTEKKQQQRQQRQRQQRKRQTNQDSDGDTNTPTMKRPPKPVTSTDEFPHLMKQLVLSDNRSTLKRVLQRLAQTEASLLKCILKWHGLRIMKTLLVVHRKDEELVQWILQVLWMCPLQSRNSLDEARLLGRIRRMAGIEKPTEENSTQMEVDSKQESDEMANISSANATNAETEMNEMKLEPIKELAKKLFNKWKDLETVYKIPKVQPQPLQQKSFTSDTNNSTNNNINGNTSFYSVKGQSSVSANAFFTRKTVSYSHSSSVGGVAVVDVSNSSNNTQTTHSSLSSHQSQSSGSSIIPGAIPSSIPSIVTAVAPSSSSLSTPPHPHHRFIRSTSYHESENGSPSLPLAVPTPIPRRLSMVRTASNEAVLHGANTSTPPASSTHSRNSVSNSGSNQVNNTVSPMASLPASMKSSGSSTYSHHHRKSNDLGRRVLQQQQQQSATSSYSASRSSLSSSDSSNGSVSNPTTTAAASVAAPVSLPSGWTVQMAPSGQLYYYHLNSLVSQWHPPSPLAHDTSVDDLSASQSQTVDSLKQALLASCIVSSDTLNDSIDTPPSESMTLDGTPAAPNATGTLTRAEWKETLSSWVIQCLSRYKDDLVDFKKIARKLTHAVMDKEMRLRPECQALSEKTREKIKKYVNSYVKRHLKSDVETTLDQEDKDMDMNDLKDTVDDETTT